MAERNQYSDETKAAVMAALLAGQSVSSVAEEYDIPRSTVGYWKSQNDSPLDSVGPEKKEAIGELLLDYLTETLITLKAQAIHFRDKSWLTEQSADQLAVLHGVTTDKAIRLLEALAKADDHGSEA